MDIHHLIQPILAIQNSPAGDEPTVSWFELGLGAVGIAVVFASLSFWYVAINRLIRKQELIPYRRSECVLGFIDLVAVCVCWLGAQVATGSVLGAVAGPEALKLSEEELFAEHGGLLLYSNAVLGIASLIACGTYLVLRYRTTNSFGLRLGQLRQQVGYGVVVFTMLVPIVLLIQFLLSLLVKYDHPVLSVLTENPSFVSIFGCWAATVLAAPFVEEFLFRGVFQHWLERLSVSKFTDDQILVGGSSLLAGNAFDNSPTLGAKGEAIGAKDEVDTVQPKFAYWPILVSSSCFALVHWGHGLAPIPLFVLAIGLGYLFRQTGSLIACVTVHFLLNFYSMFVFTVMILLGETP